MREGAAMEENFVEGEDIFVLVLAIQMCEWRFGGETFAVIGEEANS
jgi:hypothetical protein